MGRWEYRYLGFDDWPKYLTAVEVDQFCSLDPSHIALINQKADANHQLGLTLEICFLRTTGRVLNSATRVEPRVLNAIGPQIGAATPDLVSLRALYIRKRTLHDHQREAMAINSGPLSDLICSGGPWVRNSSYSSSMTVSALSFRSPRIDRHSRVNSSMIHSIR